MDPFEQALKFIGLFWMQSQNLKVEIIRPEAGEKQ